MHVAVIGCGYVGSVVGACLAETGNHVFGADTNPDRIDSLLQGRTSFYEPGLNDLISRNLARNTLRFTGDPAEAVRGAEIVFLCVGTPQGPNGKPNLDALFKAAETLAPVLEPGAVVTIRSTVPVGTTEAVGERISSRAKNPFDIAFSPEFLKEGDAVRDHMKPDRVVVGASKEEVFEKLRQLHEPFLRTMKPFIRMDIRSAEMTKYASNFLLATRISGINEVARLCDRLGADVEAVRQGVGADSRIGYPFLFPGLGYGGSCFPKDVEALIWMGSEHGLEMPVASGVQSTNRNQRRHFAQRVLKRLEGIQDPVAGVWGLSFKPRTDDVREAPSIEIVNELLKAGIRVKTYDPRANHQAAALFKGKVEAASDLYAAIDGADALLLVTEWSEFHVPDFGEVKRRLRQPLIFDGRNIWDPDELRNLGFEYFGIGRR